MTDHDALVAAICADPDEDTPRLAFADFLEEQGEAERAAFVRAQVELARTPPWEPFAVLCRWRRPDWLTGQPFRHTLPPVDGSGVEWHPEAFRRGLGWRLNVKQLIAWEQQEAQVLGRAPVGEMHLWSAATLDQWRAFAASPVVSRLRKLHLMTSPSEPLLVLRDTPEALGITDIYFDRSTGAGMPFVVEELLASPLGRVVRGLHFRMGGDAIEDLIDALNAAEGVRLERLSFDTMGLTDAQAELLMTGPAGLHLTELDLRANPLGSEGVRTVSHNLPVSAHSLGLADTGAGGRGVNALAGFRNTLRRLDLGRNPLTPRAARSLSRWTHLTDLRSLALGRCRVGERELYHLVRAKFWPNLVELDLRDNPVPPAGVRHLLDAPVPADLTALVLTGDQLGTESRGELRRKYGERVVFVAREVTGL
jgi:uncharacterized protein (TIGR02996 family)